LQWSTSTSRPTSTAPSLSKLLSSILSPYEQLDPQAQQYLRGLCAQTHLKFIDDVKRKRGNKLKADESTFSGEVWTGEEALKRGLVDEVGTLVEVLAARHPGAKLEVEPDSRSLLLRALNL
jgi:ClpP class serine protease